MKQVLTILLASIFFTVFGQKNQTIELKWKIAENEKLNYLTVMDETDVSSFKMDFGKLFKSFSDSTDEDFEKIDFYSDKINEAINSQYFVTTLTNKDNGVIDIVMTKKTKESIKETDIDTTDSEEVELAKMMQKGTIVLRGSVYETGGIHSFWVKSDQKNLIAVLFELPTKPVKVGDKWSLDISLIANAQNFECDTAYKINEVTLVEIKEINGETIAVLNYNIAEYVNGIFTFFGSDSEQKETMMKVIHQGVAEFSVDKGRWVTYNATMSIKTTGVMTTDKQTKFALIDEKNASR